MSEFEGSSTAREDAAFAALENWYDEALKNGCGFKTEEEKQTYISGLGDPLKHPLFATSTEDLEGHPLTDAFRLIREEDKTLYELCEMYKEEGNEWIKKSSKKDVKEAIDRYSHALTFLTRRAAGERVEGQEEREKQHTENEVKQLHSVVLGNRAMAHLKLGNYGSCRKDSAEAVKLWQQNMKAHYRGAKAAFMLKQYSSCVDACNAALAMQPGHKEILALHQQSTEQIQIAEERVVNRQNAMLQQLREKWQLVWRIASAQRVSLGLPLFIAPEPEHIRDMWPMTSECNSDGTISAVTWPLLLRYPQYGMFDIIQAAPAEDLLVTHLSAVFPEKGDYEVPVEWDLNDEYQASQLEVYVELHSTPRATDLHQWEMACMEHHVLQQNGEIVLLPLLRQMHQLEAKSKVASAGKEDSLERLSQRVIAREKAFAKAHGSAIVEQSSAAIPQHRSVFVKVHLGCTIQRIAQCELTCGSHPHYYTLPRGVIVLTVFPRNSDAHKQFIREQQIQSPFKTSSSHLQPSPQFQSNSDIQMLQPI